jgi:hypothetical protein
MKHFRATVLAIGVVAAVAAVAASAGSASASVPNCNATDLKAKMTVIQGSAGAGHISYKLTLKKTSPGTCLVNTHPGVKLLKANGTPLPTHVTKVGRKGFVSVRSGRSVSADLRFSPDIPGPGEPTRGPCEPAAHKIAVFLNPSSVRGPITPPTPVCGHGAIQQKPLS